MVSLIITIIVMVILAAVALVFTTSDEGIIKKAQDSLANSEREETYEKVGTSLLHKEDGKINVKDSFEAIENNLDQNVTLIAPSSEGEIGNEIIFTVEGKYETYKFKLTQTELIIIKDGSIEISKKGELKINTYRENGYTLLEIIPKITEDMLTEETACKMWTGTSSLAESMTMLFNEILGLEEEEAYENFKAFCDAYRNEEGLIEIGTIDMGGGSDSGSDSGSSIEIAPFKDEYEAFENTMQAMMLFEDEFIPETVQEMVIYMIENEYDLNAEPGTLIINGNVIDEDDADWNGISVDYEVVEEGYYEIELKVAGLEFKGTVTVDRLEDSYEGKKVYYSGINWTVLYDDEEHGIQLISDNPLGNGVTFGGRTTYSEVIQEYNNMVTILNEECSRVVSDKSKISSIRNIGGPSEEINTYFNSSSLRNTGFEWFSEYEGKILTGNKDIYEKDREQIRKLGLDIINNPYWYSVRTAYEDEPFDRKSIHFGTVKGGEWSEVLNKWMFTAKSGSDIPSVSNAETNKVRPVIQITESANFRWNSEKGYYEVK